MAEQFLPSSTEAHEYLIEDVMLALNQIAIHVQPLRRDNVAWLLKVADYQTGQQTEAERVITVRFASCLYLRTSAANTLRVEELHGIRGIKLNELLFSAALQQDPVARLDYIRTKAAREHHLPSNPGRTEKSAKEGVGKKRDAATFTILSANRFVALV